MWSLSLSVWFDNSVGLQRELAKCWASFLCRCVDKKKCVAAFLPSFATFADLVEAIPVPAETRLAL